MELTKLSPNDGKEVYEMLQHIGSCENGFGNEANGLTYSEYEQWLEKMDDWSRGKSLPEGYVPQHTYWLMDNGKPVGYGKIREQLTEASRKFGGNIGYAIDDRYRGRGYGKILMAMLITEAKRLGIEERILTVEKFNYASKAAIEDCGAILTGESEVRWYFTV